MTAQRLIGAFFSVFTVAVVVAHAVRDLLSWYDGFYTVVLIGLVCSAIWEHPFFKGFQVAVLFSTGLVIVGSGDEGKYIGPVMMTFSYMQAFTYGAFQTYAKVKIVILAVAFYAILFFIPETYTSGDYLKSGLWLFMCAAIQFLLWVNARDWIAKARELEELKRRHLEQKVRTSEALLEETVKAGMVLVKEIKSEEGKDGCSE